MCIRDRSDDFADFLLKCAQNGILVYYNPEHTIDLKFMLAEQKERNPRAKFTRAKTLGWFYETEQIKSRIVHYKKAMEYKPKARIVRVPVQVEENKFIPVSYTHLVYHTAKCRSPARKGSLFSKVPCRDNP